MSISVKPTKHKAFRRHSKMKAGNHVNEILKEHRNSRAFVPRNRAERRSIAKQYKVPAALLKVLFHENPS